MMKSLFVLPQIKRLAANLWFNFINDVLSNCLLWRGLNGQSTGAFRKLILDQMKTTVLEKAQIFTYIAI